MKLRRIISKRIEHDGEGISVRAAGNAAVAANVNERTGDASVSSEQHVVQRSRRTAATPPNDKEAPDE